ncbi:extracellular solute-binding protein [Streptomyces beijiangensis]|uniref:Extracellular solute-binding protein n=1 Tax=Streptomyces beijiangensis TaxID=163361 RepID=A0A939JEK4_9ACTN|nr:extracellular solute-binding protein [Streptomyces beijiangensis]MBO0511443.1 extracellular solute-binding protein [Streptomyces beijiangensis]
MPGMSRRSFLNLSTAVAAGAVATPLLTACGSAANKKTEAASSKVKLPTYVPFDKVKPDLAPNAQGLSAGFLTYPKTLVQSVSKKPGDGSKVTVLTEMWTAPPKPKGSNAYWDTLSKEMGIELNAILGSDPGYPDKFSATIAANDLPDLMWIPPNQGIQHVAQLLEAKCADLTELLSGDAVKAYPNLANMQPAHWKTAVVNGKIWGAPSPYPAFGQVYGGNPRIWEKAGGLSAASPEEFLSKCKEVTGAKTWALEPIYVNAVSVLSQCYGAPNKWLQNKDGSLTFWMETDEYAEALSFAIKLKKAGVFYPGDPEMADAYIKMAQGTIGACVYPNPKAVRTDTRTNDPELAGQVLIPFSAGGSAPKHARHLGTIGYTAIKKSSPERVKMLLEVLNYIAAPYGTKEQEFLKFGVEGEDFTYDGNGYPKYTKTGKSEVEGLYSGLSTATVAPASLSASDFQGSAQAQDVRDIYAVEQKLIPMIALNPTIGHYSDANTEHYPKMSTDANDLVNDIVAGRKNFSEWKSFWSDWKPKGLDQMRHEYEKAIATDA